MSASREYKSPIQTRIDAGLGSLRRLVRASLVLRGGSLLLVAIAAVIYVSFGLDRTFRLSNIGRAVTLIAILGSIGWVAMRFLIRPLLVPIPRRTLADLIEKHYPQLGDRLRSAVDFLRQPEVGDLWSPPASADEDSADLTLAMKRRVAQEAAQSIETLETGAVVDTPRVVSALTGGMVAIGAIGILAVLLGGTLGIWFQRQFLFADVDYEYRTGLVVRGFDENRTRGVPRGDPIEITVDAFKEVPGRVAIRLEFPTGTARYNMEIRPNAVSQKEGGVVFLHEHGSVTEDFEFTVEGGDYRSKPYRVRVLDRPQVESLTITGTPPEYTGEEPTEIAGDVGEISVPAGSRLALEGIANKPLLSASLETEGKVIALEIDSGDSRRFSGGWLPETGGAATVRLEDREQVPPDRFLQFSTHLVVDRQPSVQVKVVGLGPLITNAARMPFVISARDDYRIDELLIAWELQQPEGAAKSDEVVLPIDALPSREPLENLEHVWEVRDLNTKPEKRLNLRIGATDNDALAGAKTGYSPILSYLIVTPERLTDELVRREIEQRRVLERIITEERKVRDEIYRLIDESWSKEGDIAEKDVELMLSLARIERQHGRALESIASAVEQILAEMENNRLGGKVKDLERLRDDISVPLRELANETLPAISQGLGRVREDKDPRSRVVRGVEVGALVDGKLETLDEILAAMSTLETFTEIVKLLQAIIRVHGESAVAVDDAYRALIDDVFEPFGDDDDDGDDESRGSE